jgi:chitinase
MPVPLEYLFENPPPEDEANADFDLKVDPTWGGQRNNPFDADPDDAPFGFVVMVSPEEIQVSLDKRDGSHWEVFNCEDTEQTEQQHTVQMVCTETGDGSNCHKIQLGHGVPGTILQMPSGCGPGKYAVAHSLQPSRNQSMPGHLARRGITETVYDLTFDYDFRRVPRDLGDTQLRIDWASPHPDPSRALFVTVTIRITGAGWLIKPRAKSASGLCTKWGAITVAGLKKNGAMTSTLEHSHARTCISGGSASK